ncbi:tagaturonate reductase [Marinilabiliaceae bacterium JC017]|nr:tagaturonate reductase [Marinilabiliaceae bacterium JC017]
MRVQDKYNHCAKAPEKIIQFGEGNFLRAFVDWMIHTMNKKLDFNASVVMVQPIETGMADMINNQEGYYTLLSSGIENGEAHAQSEVIQSVSRAINPYSDPNSFIALAHNPDFRFVISNTTEAGIAFDSTDTLNMTPPKSFPAKVTRLLHERFTIFHGDTTKGFIFLPCELIDRNGDQLRNLVMRYARLWQLGETFEMWVKEANHFCNTLVDRIVPGFPRDRHQELQNTLGYEDNLMVEAELFHLWVIEGPDFIQKELPARQCGLNVVFTNNMEPYRTRKVRILNGLHTLMTPLALLAGIETVQEAVEHPVMGEFIRCTTEGEIIPTLDLPLKELQAFSSAVMDRFLNPFIHHRLSSIALNTVSKFKTRVLPSIEIFLERKQQLPANLLWGWAGLIAFYKGTYNNQSLPVNDNPDIINTFSVLWQKVDGGQMNLPELVHHVLEKSDWWGKDFNMIAGLNEEITVRIKAIGAGNFMDQLKKQS